jgi:hypothetical protein
MVIFIETITFSDALKFPFKVPARLLYALLLLIPILGWIILFGYGVRLINEFIEGRYNGPIKIEYIEDLKLGFIAFVKLIPLYIVHLIIVGSIMYASMTLGKLVNFMLAFFILPMLIVNFMRKQTVGSAFEFQVLNVVKDNSGDYIVTMLKQILLGFIFMLLSFVLIGIPALIFTNSIFIANFYGKYIEQKHTLALGTQAKDPLTA